MWRQWPCASRRRTVGALLVLPSAQTGSTTCTPCCAHWTTTRTATALSGGSWWPLRSCGVRAFALPAGVVVLLYVSSICPITLWSTCRAEEPGSQERLAAALDPLMWRNTKAGVAGDTLLPPRELALARLPFTQAEHLFYCHIVANMRVKCDELRTQEVLLETPGAADPAGLPRARKGAATAGRCASRRPIVGACVLPKGAHGDASSDRLYSMQLRRPEARSGAGNAGELAAGGRRGAAPASVGLHSSANDALLATAGWRTPTRTGRGSMCQHEACIERPG